MEQNSQKSQIQSILSHRFIKDKNNQTVPCYKILWKGPTLSNCTWQTAENLKKFKAIIETYNRNHQIEQASSQIAEMHEGEQQFRDDEYNKWRGRKKSNYTRGIEGRPPTNNLPRPYKGPDKQTIARSNINQVKNQPEFKSYMRLQQQRNKRDIKVQAVFRDIPSDKIIYKVEQNNTLTYRTRQWIMSRSKIRLIQFYESLIRVQNQF